MSRAHVTVLLSGGIDSAATLAFYKKRRGQVDAVFFDYGQKPRASEWKAAQAIADHFRIAVARVRVGITLPLDDGEFFGRNAVFILAAAAATAERPAVIALGIHAGCPYYDTTTAFVNDMQRLLDGYAEGSISVAAPFLESTKKEVVGFTRKHRVPLHLTYSCEQRNSRPCGKCASCIDRRGAHVD